MAVTLIDGKAVANKIKVELHDRITLLKQRGIVPGLAVILVGEDPASQVYVNMKQKTCDELGIHSETTHLPADISQAELLRQIDRFNSAKDIHGILVQLPLPKHIDTETVIARISVDKDVDGFNPYNVGKLMVGKPRYVPCTPAGILELLHHYGFYPDGKHVVIVGRSNIVGKPLANLLLQKTKGCNATVTICHTGTTDLGYFTSQAEILVVAAGRPGAVTAEMVKEGVVVIDVGVNRVADSSTTKGYRLVGDVDFNSVSQKAKAITPVPGGVGPMTIVMLMKNTVIAAETLN